MVLQKAVNNLKDKPKDERAAVAGGIAVTVVIILLIAWGIYFFRQIQSGVVRPNLDTGAQGNFTPEAVRNAGKQLQEFYSGDNTDELIQLRESAAQGQVGGTQQMQTQGQSGGADQFGNINTGN